MEKVEKKNRIVGVQKESLEKLLVIQRTISEAILECLNKIHDDTNIEGGGGWNTQTFSKMKTAQK